ncbi:MAG: ABC transporter ATP-binding protein [Planctomycetes bacterium]|nr:ABC transporter ATP-binding protein [Planctomycetota bacterium]
MIKINNLTGTYRKGATEIKALDDLTLDIAEGEFATIQGPSGSGKTTLLMTLGTMLQPASGQVVVQNQNVYALSQGQRNRFRAAHIGFVFQMFHLVPYLSVFDNIMLAAVKQNTTTRARAQTLLYEFGLWHRSTHRPEQLSTGEKQRTAIARALLNDPPLILADEPTGNLDPENARIVLDHLQEIHKTGCTIVVVTHGQEIECLATQHIRLVQGRLA